MSPLTMLVLAAAACQAPDANAIIVGTVERVNRDVLTGARVEFLKDRYKEDTSDALDIHLEETVVSLVRTNGRQKTEQKLMKNGKPVRNSKPSPSELDLSRLLSDRFLFSMADPCPVNIAGSDHWAIHFEPRPGLPEGDDLEEKLLNHLAGILYVDKERWFLRHATARLAEPFNQDVIGTVEEGSINLEQQEFAGVVVQRYVVVDIAYTINLVFFKRHKSMRLTYDFREFKTVQQ